MMDNSFDVRYAPKVWNDIVFPNPIVQRQLNAYIDNPNTKPILLYGPNGTGKTTIARCLPYAMIPGFHNVDYLELIAEHRTNVANQLNKINTFAHTMALNQSSLRVLTIDEADNYPRVIQSSLRSHIDRLRKSCLFILTTNDFYRIDKGIRSRARAIKIDMATPKEWLPRIKHILTSEDVRIPPDANMIAMVNGARGDVRKLLEDLQDYVERARSLPLPTPPLASIIPMSKPPSV